MNTSKTYSPWSRHAAWAKQVSLQHPKIVSFLSNQVKKVWFKSTFNSYCCKSGHKHKSRWLSGLPISVGRPAQVG